MSERVNNPTGKFEERRKAELEDRERFELRRLSDYSIAHKTAEMRRIGWDLLKETHIFASCFDPDPVKMAYNEGRRDIGLHYLRLLNKAAPTVLAQMQREAAQERKNKEKNNG